MVEQWGEQSDNIRIQLLAEGKTYREVANHLNIVFNTDKFTPDSVRGRSRRTNTNSQTVQIDTTASFEDRWDTFCSYIGQRRTEIKDKPKLNIDNEFAVLSDIHCPQHNMDVITNIVESIKGGIKTCVVAGDYMDTGSFSPHYANNRPDVDTEIKEAKVLANYLNDSFDTVVFIMGNHENWYNKAKSKLPREFQSILKDYLIEYIIADLNHCYSLKTFYTQIGDCVVGHPSMFRQKRMSDVLVSYGYFTQWASRLGLNAPVRAYIHAHTHKLGSLYVEHNGGVSKVFEGGALCMPSEHLTLGSTVQYAPPMEGWVHVVQDNGRTLLNNSREYYVEVEPQYSYVNIEGYGKIKIL